MSNLNNVKKQGQPLSSASKNCAYLNEQKQIDWEKVLNANEKWIRKTIALRVGEQSAVDEVFQEVALAVTSQKAPLKDPDKIGAWLYRLVVIQSALYRRKAGRKRNFLKQYEEDIGADQSILSQLNPLDWLLKKERQELVRTALKSLDNEEQTILFLKYRDGLSYREIAHKLSTSELAVQSRLHRARIHLKTLLLKKSDSILSDF